MIVKLDMSEDQLKFLRAMLSVWLQEHQQSGNPERRIYFAIAEAEEQLDNQLYPSSAS